MRDLGCAFGQGYVFSIPLPAAELLAGFGMAVETAKAPATSKAQPVADAPKRLARPRVARLAPGA